MRRGTIDNDKRGPEATLDDLYLGILQRTSALTDSVTATTYVVGSILVAKSPLTPTGLDALLRFSEDTLQYPVTAGWIPSETHFVCAIDQCRRLRPSDK